MPKAFSVLRISSTIVLNSSGSIEKAASGPPIALLKMKCFSTIFAPNATAATATECPIEWSERPATTLKRLVISGIVKTLASSKGVG